MSNQIKAPSRSNHEPERRTISKMNELHSGLRSKPRLEPRSGIDGQEDANQEGAKPISSKAPQACLVPIYLFYFAVGWPDFTRMLFKDPGATLGGSARRKEPPASRRVAYLLVLHG